MGLYRKKPVVIEARQLVRPDQCANPADFLDYFTELRKWCGATQVAIAPDGARALVIDTLEGQMKATPGDWIIRGVKGEFYPCRNDIFAQTYEKAD